MKSIAQRFHSATRTDLADCLILRVGTLGDYGALAEFHYLASRPVTATRVVVMEAVGASVAERFRNADCGLRNGGGEECGARVTHGQADASPSPGSRTRRPLPRRGEVERDPIPATPYPIPESRPRIVAVLVESYPALSCVLRDEATGGRYRGWRGRGDSARLLNAEVRCVSRVVVHPQWRGVGLAVRIVKHALSTATTAYTEALAAMGRVHPFFRLAGMREYQRWPLGKDQRLLDAMRFAGAEAWELASEARMRGHLEKSALLRDELSRWAGRRLSVTEQMEKAREGLLCEPVYYIKARED